ncbi:hypothetical protein SK128_009469 [Halocaridina rubra]|uniref:Uncharacterized protein n=1 Tax=Halocaridina rubra TaxID=373956 RepID=A0AAN8WP86_HALRR
MDEAQSNSQNISHSYKCLNSKCKPIRIEEKNRVTFTTFKILGLFLIKWNEEEEMYSVHKIRFKIYYTLWFLWPLAGLGIAVLGKEFFNSDEASHHINDVIETAFFVLGYAVVPAVKTYAIYLITKHLPGVLEDIASLSEVDIGFQTPLTIHLPSREQKSLLPKKAAQKALKDRQLDRSLFVFPVITVFVSVITFIAAWVYGLIRVIEWDTLKAEWPFITMQFTYLTLPTITTWFCVIFIEWLRMVYEALRVEAEYYHYNMIKQLKETNEATPEVSLTEWKIKSLGDYVDKLQEIFNGLSEGFIKYILGINFLVFLLSSIFSSVKLLLGYEHIIYMIPLSIAIFHVGLACYKSNCLIDEYTRITSVLNNVLRLQRRNPNLIPYNELHILRENLLDSPPQVVIFGDFRIGNGFLIAIQGFIISYAVLANDVLAIQENNGTNCNTTIENIY